MPASPLDGALRSCGVGTYTYCDQHLSGVCWLRNRYQLTPRHPCRRIMFETALLLAAIAAGAAGVSGTDDLRIYGM